MRRRARDKNLNAWVRGRRARDCSAAQRWRQKGGGERACLLLCARLHLHLHLGTDAKVSSSHVFVDVTFFAFLQFDTFRCEFFLFFYAFRS